MSVTSLAPEASASANFATIAEGTSFGSLHPLDKLDNRRVREMSQLEISVFSGHVLGGRKVAVDI